MCMRMIAYHFGVAFTRFAKLECNAANLDSRLKCTVKLIFSPHAICSYKYLFVQFDYSREMLGYMFYLFRSLVIQWLMWYAKQNKRVFAFIK